MDEKLRAFTQVHEYREVVEKSDAGEEKKYFLDIGRSWRADELRIKSNEDLNKLWHVLIKERNRVLSDGYHRFNKLGINQKLCLNKLTKSMNRLKGVLNERQVVRNEFRKWMEQEYLEKSGGELQELLESESHFL